MKTEQPHCAVMRNSRRATDPQPNVDEQQVTDHQEVFLMVIIPSPASGSHLPLVKKPHKLLTFAMADRETSAGADRAFISFAEIERRGASK